MKTTSIDVKRMRELFALDSTTGALTRRRNKGRAKEGDVAGYLNGDGYLIVGVDGKYFKAHRIVYAMNYNAQPLEVDHINGIRCDNRPLNLRAADHAENQQNTRVRRNNTSGETGVTWSRRSGKWHVQAVARGQPHHGGYFSDRKEAAEKARELRIDVHKNFAAKLGAQKQ